MKNYQLLRAAASPVLAGPGWPVGRAWTRDVFHQEADETKKKCYDASLSPRQARTSFSSS